MALCLSNSKVFWWGHVANTTWCTPRDEVETDFWHRQLILEVVGTTAQTLGGEDVVLCLMKRHRLLPVPFWVWWLTGDDWCELQVTWDQIKSGPTQNQTTSCSQVSFPPSHRDFHTPVCLSTYCFPSSCSLCQLSFSHFLSPSCFLFSFLTHKPLFLSFPRKRQSLLVTSHKATAAVHIFQCKTKPDNSQWVPVQLPSCGQFWLLASAHSKKTFECPACNEARQGHFMCVAHFMQSDSKCFT